MTDIGSDVSVSSSSVWGTRPPTVDLVALAAATVPDAVAFRGAQGDVVFAALNDRVAPTASVFSARGMEPDAALSAIVTTMLPRELLTPADVARVTAETVDTIRSAAEEVLGSSDWQSLPGIFRSAALRFAGRIAVKDETGASLTYRELDGRSDDVARALYARGIGAGDVVGLATPRTVDVIVAILGILKAGAAYLPLDVSHPADRLSYIVDTARPSLLLSDAEGCAALSYLGIPGCTTEDLVATADGSDSPPVAVDQRCAAYMIFTSGSTGRPKGVVVEQRSVVSLMRAAQKRYGFDETDVWTMFHSYAFDVSVFEMWGALLFGGRLVVLDYLTTRSPGEFARLLHAEAASVVSQTPSAFYQLAAAVRPGAEHTLSPSVRYMVFAGEALDFAQVRRWYADREAVAGSPGPTLVNMYGITETTVHSTFRALDPVFVTTAHGSDVGQALPELTIHLLDERLRRVPDGVPGEIYVSGTQVTRGYLDQPALTSARFVADPFAGDARRMYRSGDIGIFRDGTLEYLGRSDAQIKLRGFRIEQGEVEAAMLSAAGVAAAAVAVRANSVGTELLVGYVVAAAGTVVDPAAVREAVGTKVPGYMVPDVVMVLDELPLTVNGKLDRRALPAPVVESSVEYVAPETEVEQTLSSIVADVLGLDRIGVTESIFDLGANSLSAARIVGRVCEELEVDFNLRDLFDAPTIREIAGVIGGLDAALPPLTAASPRPERLPLSFAQRRIWFINRFSDGADGYVIPAVMHLSGDVDIVALRAALADVVARHEVLRTTYPEIDGVPFASVSPVEEIAGRLDWATVDSAADLDTLAFDEFDLSAQWPIRARVCATGTGEYDFALVLHHIAADGESLAPLFADLGAYYAHHAAQTPISLPSLEIQFADFAIWQHRALGSTEHAGSVVAEQLSYWTARLGGLPDVLGLPTDRQRPAVASHRGGRVEFSIPASLGERVLEAANSSGATPFMVLHGALAVLLARLSASTDIAIATPIAGRGRRALDPLVGMFVNTLVLRTEIDPGMSFETLLQRIREIDLDAFAHSDVPFEEVVEALSPTRSAAFASLAQVMLSFDPAASARRTALRVAGIELSPREPQDAPEQLDLTITVSSADPGHDWWGAVSYATDLFEADTVTAFAQRLILLLDELLAEPDRPVGDMALITPREAEAIVRAGSGELCAVPPHTVADLVARQVRREPDRIALRFGDREVDFREFGARTESLARELIARGVGPEVAVGVCIERSVEMVVAIHAIVAAGGAYVPIDTQAPSERVEYMLRTAGARLLLIGRGDEPAAIEGIEVDRLRVSCDSQAPALAEPISQRERNGLLLADNTIYTMFTSGSTGRPKGVSVTHGAMVSHLAYTDHVYGRAGVDRILCKTTYTFDASVWELFWAPTTSATMVIARPGGHRDIDYLVELIRAEGIHVVEAVPAVWSAIFDDAQLVSELQSSDLRLLVTGGEALTPALAAQIRSSLPDVHVINQYGPTEATNYVLDADISTIDRLSVGSPVYNTTVAILDSRLNLVPAGVIGELYVGGAQLARGYVNRPDLTADRFVADPFGPAGARMYRTGDLVRRLPTGDIDYVGRVDFQVKIRGQRIELGEIDGVLAAAPGVSQAAAQVRTGPAGQQVLVGYLCGDDVDVDRVRDHCARNLLDFMVPDHWTVVDEMPLGSAGKVDRRALPEPDFSVDESAYRAPESRTEMTIVGVIEDVLGIEHPSTATSFFDLGGNSLSAMRVVSRIGQQLGVDVSVRDLFDHPTVAELADALSGRHTGLPPVVAVSQRPERLPLSYAQNRMWFINRFDPTSGAYNIPSVLRIRGDLDATALRRAVGDVVARHDILRTRFLADDGEPFQHVDPVSDIDARLDWQVVSDADDIARSASDGFDLQENWPIRGRLWSQTPNEHVVALVLHHIAADGESMAPLTSDLMLAYAARREDDTPVFAPLPVQFADFALWQRDVFGEPDDPTSISASQIEFWREALAQLPDVISLPTDRPRPQVASNHGAQLDFWIDTEVTEGIGRLAHERGVTRFMVVHAALAAVLSRLSGDTDIAIATPIAGRGQRELDQLIGMFVNTIVLRTRVRADEACAALLDRVREVDLDAFAHADVPFEAVVDAVAPVRSESFGPLAQVMLAFDESASIDVLSELAHQAAGLQVEAVEPDNLPAKYDLGFTISPADDSRGWAGSLSYATDLFDRATAAAIVRRFIDMLTAVTRDVAAVVGDVPLMRADELREMQRRSTGPVVALPARTMADSLQHTTLRQLDRVAVISGDRQVTKRELHSRVTGLARTLIAAGVGPEVAVAVVMPRGVDLVVAVHAVIVAGGQFVPIDPGTPVARAERMAATTGVRLILVSITLDEVPALRGLDGIPRIEVDTTTEVDSAVDPVTDADRRAPLHVDNAVYTLFTSGSTGEPKGVTVTHRGLGNQMDWLMRTFELTADERVLLKTPVTFDVSVFEILLPTFVGGAVVTVGEAGDLDPRLLARQIVDAQVTLASFVPSLLATFCDVLGTDVTELRSFRNIFVGGEALTPDVVQTVYGLLPDVSLWNLYGPAEVTITSTHQSLAPGDDSAPIGSPNQNLTAHVLDARLSPVPVGVVGELYVGGVQVARGYASDGRRSAERFVADPFGAPGERLYRTGDLVKWNHAGTLDYLGRVDFQVKLRGQRFELGEVESAVHSVPGVVHAAVSIHTDPQTGAQDVVAYYAPASVPVDTIEEAVRQRLPEYMRPTIWMPLDAIELNANGKVDRRALPQPARFMESARYVAPASPREQAVADIVADVIGVARISVTESFFSAGGNSLSAMRVVARVATVLDVDVSVRDLFDHPSVRALCTALDGRAHRAGALVAGARPERIPLSSAQQRMWFINQFDTSSSSYNIPMALRLHGPLDRAALRAALIDVIERHEILRTVYPSDDGGPIQQILDMSDVERVLDWKVVDLSEGDAAAEATRDAVGAGFDVSQELPIRVRLATYGATADDSAGTADTTDLVVTVHHIAFDGESTSVFIRDLLSAYAVRTGVIAAPEPAPQLQYADFAVWQRAVAGERIAPQMEYWRRQLADLPQVTDLPTDRPRPAVFEGTAGMFRSVVEDALAADLEEFARAHELTMFMVCHAALAITVARLASTEDVVIGSAIAGRSDEALNDLIGMFVNTLVLRTAIDGAATIAECVAELRRVDVDAFANADVQFDDLVDELAPERATSFAPLAQIGFTFVSAARRAHADRLEIGEITASPLDVDEYSASLDLLMAVADRTDTSPMAVEITYATALFDEDTIARFEWTWKRILAAMVTADDLAVGDIDIVGDSDIVGDRESAGDRPDSVNAARQRGFFPIPFSDGGTEPAPLIELLSRREIDPDLPALVYAGGSMTYRDFESRTNRIARSLIREGLGVDDVIALGLERSPESVMAAIAVAKTGAAFVPVDPRYPTDRVEYMITDSRARVGICAPGTFDTQADGCRWLDITSLGEGMDDRPLAPTELNGRPRADNLAYLIYTSGSTGTPKAVAVSQRGMANLLTAHDSITSPDVGARLLHVASPSFDAAFDEVLRAIGHGHTLVIAGASDYAGEALARVIDEGDVTDIVITPTVLGTLDPRRAGGLRNIMTVGEACPADLVASWATAERRVFNLYGPSETTIWATSARSRPEQAVTIGRPIRGFTAYVLDQRLHPVPRGVVGEIYLGSQDSLAHGYFRRPGLSATRFVADPFSGVAGARMYVTGDMAKVDRRGDLVFVGRADHQVKINGQRVELGEIEAVLADVPAVGQAVVIGSRDDNGRNRLVAYVVPAAGNTVTESEVLIAARSRLAHHMVPHRVVVIDELPVTPGGKLDIRSLPQPDRGTTDDIVEPQTAAESALAQIISGLLGVDRVDVTESFFALGGDSIMSIQLASAARMAGVVLTPRQIFEHRTIRAMARAAAEDQDLLPLLTDMPSDAPTPLPPIVSWMIEHSTEAQDFADFSQSIVLYAPPTITERVLADILTALVRTHPEMSTRLSSDNGHWTRESVDFDGFAAVSTAFTSARVGTDEFAEVLESAHADALADLAPERGALVRAVLVVGDDGPLRLVFVVHHLAVDAVSWPIIVEDLATAWAQLHGGTQIALRDEVTTQRAWTAAVADQTVDRDVEEDYWASRLPATDDDRLRLVADRDRVRTMHSVTRSVDETTTEAVLTLLPKAFGGNVNDVLLGTLARALDGWALARGMSRAPWPVLVEGHGRYDDVLEQGPVPRRADLSRTVGWFTSIAPVLVEPGPDAIHAVKAAKEERLGMPGRGIGFGVLRYQSESALATRALPAIGFNYLGARGAVAENADSATVDLIPDSTAAEPPSTVTGAMVVPNAIAVNVSVDLGENGRRLVIDGGYASHVVSGVDMDDLMSRWMCELDDLVTTIAGGRDPGLSPADVPGVQIDQSELDKLALDYPAAAVWPSSPLQAGLYVESKRAVGPHVGDSTDGVDVYSTQAIIHFDGHVDPTRLRTSARDLLLHHSALRSGFVQTPRGAVVAVVPPTVEVPWREVAVEPGSIETQIADVAAAESRAPFDLARPPLLRIVLVSRPDGHSVVITNHHILFDGWSGPLVLADLLALYATGTPYTPGPSPSRPDFGTHVKILATKDDSIGDRAWRTVLERLTEPTLVGQYQHPTTDAMPRDHTFGLGRTASDAIDRLARERGVTVSTILQFAWAVLLSRMTGNQVVAFGETVSGRPADLEGAEALVGLFINTLPAVVDVDPEATVATVLGRLQADKLTVIDHQHRGLTELTALTGLPVLFDTLTAYESYPVDSAGIADAASGGLSISGIEASDATHYPLNLTGTPTPDGIALTLKYLPGAFSGAQITVLEATLRAIVSGIVDRPDSPVCEIDLAPGARGVALHGGPPAVPPTPLAEIFSRAARRRPEWIAVTDEDGNAMTYRELDEASNRLARWLIAQGAGAESLIALALPRSVALLTAIWAVAKSGAAYVPIDPGYPSDRIELMLEDSGAGVGLCTSSNSDLPGASTAWHVIDTPDFAGTVDSVSAAGVTDADRGRPLSPLDLAYVIYTSGSTGRPKGVAVTGSGLANFAAEEVRSGDAGPDARVLGFASPSFDASVLEYLLAAVSGGTLVYRPATAAGGDELVRFISEQAVSHTFLTPSVLATLDPTRSPSLQCVFAGGEAVGGPLKDRWAEAGIPLRNLYGPTEATVAVAIGAPMARTEQVSLGTPIAGIDFLVLDSRLRPVPMGFPGDLYVRGTSLARGYLARPALTAAAFVADPYGTDGSRLYRTGDVVRLSHEASGHTVVEYLGRSDDQVKLRGLRIELGEIESVLGSFDDIRSVVVVGVGGPQATSLAAYVVTDAPVEISELKEFAAGRLPGYMVPDSIMVLDALPLTPVGKLDRRALPEPEVTTGTITLPDSPHEHRVASVFAEVLGVETVSVTDSFFDLGGNSLSAMRVIARAGEVLGVELSIRDLFDAPSVRQLVALSRFRQPALAEISAVSPRPQRIPLSFGQQRMWFINQFEPEQATYNVPIVLRLTGQVDPDILLLAVRDVVERQEILRTVFPADADGAHQVVLDADDPSAEPDWAVVDSIAEIGSAIRTGFDVTAAPPWRVRVVENAAGEWILAAVLHHIVADGESMAPLVTDLAVAYAARRAGTEPEFAPLPVQFADFAVWQHATLGNPADDTSVAGRQLSYWAEQLGGLPDVLDLPADRPRPAVASHHGARVDVAIPERVAELVRTVARTQGATPFMVVHAALAVVLARLSAEDEIAVATPIAGRGQQSLDGVVGMFVNTLILRAHVELGMSFIELLDQVRTTDLEAYAHADVPFEAVVERLNPVRSESFSPLAQVMLTVGEGDRDAASTIGGLTVEPFDTDFVPAQVDLTVDIRMTDQGPWSLAVLYAVDLFDAERMSGFGSRVVSVLGALLTEPDLPVARAPFLTEEEHSVVGRWSDGGPVSEDKADSGSELGLRVSSRRVVAQQLRIDG
ncbi:amino acid adenylation domain-containing protein [Gordonia otitidis]|uniref:non-ribosomal peptide synthetase n=1 Tax=Gordonia otitidis TaxID=249058 RepID=UPI001D156D38|nr:non-ribosomal peptide synthetase [Gordonia otitidis]UEA58096.1 amino acid adenylation domain-containing protein [Gordonia otitidis]